MAFGHLIPQLRLEEPAEDGRFRSITFRPFQHGHQQRGKSSSPRSDRKRHEPRCNCLCVCSSKGITTEPGSPRGPRLMSQCSWDPAVSVRWFCAALTAVTTRTTTTSLFFYTHQHVECHSSRSGATNLKDSFASKSVEYINTPTHTHTHLFPSVFALPHMTLELHTVTLIVQLVHSSSFVIKHHLSTLKGITLFCPDNTCISVKYQHASCCTLWHLHTAALSKSSPSFYSLRCTNGAT